jgi:hypothetical protein
MRSQESVGRLDASYAIDGCSSLRRREIYP